MMHTAKSYAAEWATLTGRSESEVYVPVALREEPAEPTLDELRALLKGKP